MQVSKLLFIGSGKRARKGVGFARKRARVIDRGRSGWPGYADSGLFARMRKVDSDFDAGTELLSSRFVTRFFSLFIDYFGKIEWPI